MSCAILVQEVNPTGASYCLSLDVIVLDLEDFGYVALLSNLNCLCQLSGFNMLAISSLCSNLEESPRYSQKENTDT